MKVYYDKWGKRGFLKNFIITDSSNNELKIADTNTLIDGSYIFRDVNFPQYDENLETEIRWDYPLSSLKNGTGMFSYCRNLTLFTPDLLELTNGAYMFSYCSNLESFNSKLGTPTSCYAMFRGCSKLKEIDLGESLINCPQCQFMFENCKQLSKFTGNLSNVVYGYNLFFGCPLEILQSDSEGSPINLSSLQDSRQMFYFCRLLNFDIDLNNVTSGAGMFGNSTWREKDDNGKEITKGITSFTGSLNSLKTAGSMFINCHAMTEFKPKGGLPNLTDGNTMFSSCINLNDYYFNFRSFDRVKIEKDNEYKAEYDSLVDKTNYPTLYDYVNEKYKAEYDSLVDKTNYPTLNDYVNEKVNEKYKAEYDSLVDKTNYPTLNDYVNEKVWEYITLKNYFISGTRMFNGCIGLSYSGLDNNNNRKYEKVFNTDLSLFKNGNRMFERCYTLKFNSKLDSLLYGYNMFENTALDKTSIQNIANNIQDVNDIEDIIRDDQGNIIKDNTKSVGWKYLTITIDKKNTSVVDNETVINTDIKTEIQKIVDKGWTVAVNLYDSSYFNGDGYKEDGIPYYAKRFETTSKGAPYIDKDDKNKYYYVLGGHFIFPKSEQSNYIECTSKATFVSTLNLKSNPDRY